MQRNSTTDTKQGAPLLAVFAQVGPFYPAVVKRPGHRRIGATLFRVGRIVKQHC